MSYQSLAIAWHGIRGTAGSSQERLTNSQRRILNLTGKLIMINTSFAQDCPACSRKLRVRLAYLGRQVACQHCKAEFIAAETASRSSPQADWRDSLLQRADELLRRVELLSEFA
jgi:hypothetical protein